MGLAKIAEMAPWLSDAEMHDLACQLAREASDRGAARVAIVASRQAQLASLAHEAIMLLPDLTAGPLVTRPGIFAADGAASRVTLLLPGGDPATGPAPARPADDAAGQAAALAWLDRLGVQAAAAVGRGLGEITGLAWAGCLPEEQAARLAVRCGDILAGPADSAAELQGRSAQLRALLAEFAFTGPRHRLFSAATGRALASVSDIVEALCAQPGSPDRLDEALTAGAAGADLLIETGPGQSLSAAAQRCCQVPVISLAAGARTETGIPAGLAPGAGGRGAGGRGSLRGWRGRQPAGTVCGGARPADQHLARAGLYCQPVSGAAGRAAADASRSGSRHRAGTGRPAGRHRAGTGRSGSRHRAGTGRSGQQDRPTPGQGWPSPPRRGRTSPPGPVPPRTRPARGEALAARRYAAARGSAVRRRPPGGR